MTGESHPVDELLRSVVGDPTPDHEAVVAGQRLLLAAMRAEADRPAHTARGGRIRRSATVGVAAMLIAVTAAVGATVLTSRPVTALGDLAVLAERATAPVVPTDDSIYSKVRETFTHYVPGADLGLPTTGTVAYHLPIVRERWVGSDGVREISSVGEPSFFNPAHKRAYNRSGQRVVDGVGEVSNESFGAFTSILDERPWSTDPAELLEQLRVASSSQRGDLTEDAAIVDLALTMLGEPLLQPELRSALFQALSELGAGDVRPGLDGTTTLSLDYSQAGTDYRLVADFDGNANLVRRALVRVSPDPALGLPGNTVEHQIEFLVLQPVSRIGAG